MAVTSGDNSNILIARVARETFGVERVVARIYDPKRAVIYERLGIPTVASVSWTSARALRHVLPDPGHSDWIDPTSTYALVERKVPAATAGVSIAQLDEAGLRVALLTRTGTARIPDKALLVQQDDLVHLLVADRRDGRRRSGAARGRRPPMKIVIAGAGSVGRYMADQLHVVGPRRHAHRPDCRRSSIGSDPTDPWRGISAMPVNWPRSRRSVPVTPTSWPRSPATTRTTS